LYSVEMSIDSEERPRWDFMTSLVRFGDS
jgi:hypothetical protein